jgi:hypothetical protein
MYILGTRRRWRACEGPAAAPTLHDYLDVWSYDGTLDRIYHVAGRQQENREASATGATSDSQSVGSLQKGADIGQPDDDAGQEDHEQEAPHFRRCIASAAAGDPFIAPTDRDRRILLLATSFGRCLF